jgi:hypothetical protein
VKRTVAFLILLVLLSLLVLSSGCGNSKNGDRGNGNKIDGDSDRVEFDKGFVEGRTEGYAKGYSDGKQNVYNPVAPEEASPNDDYAMGYGEGWVAGYDKGHEDALKEASDAAAEMAEVEAAMLAFVKQNAAPGLEFRIEHIVIQGDEAAAIAVCTSEILETPLIVMKKGATGWYGVDFGTGIEPPSWYPY